MTLVHWNFCLIASELTEGIKFQRQTGKAKTENHQQQYALKNQGETKREAERHTLKVNFG